jgi:hypothetical protein
MQRSNGMQGGFPQSSAGEASEGSEAQQERSANDGEIRSGRFYIFVHTHLTGSDSFDSVVGPESAKEGNLHVKHVHPQCENDTGYETYAVLLLSLSCHLLMLEQHALSGSSASRVNNSNFGRGYPSPKHSSYRTSLGPRSRPQQHCHA